MIRIVGLLVEGLTLAMVGFASAALFWLGVVGLVVFVGTGFVAAMHPAMNPVEPPGSYPVAWQPKRALGRGVRGAQARQGHRPTGVRR
jgi:hypothetical protein